MKNEEKKNVLDSFFDFFLSLRPTSDLENLEYLHLHLHATYLPCFQRASPSLHTCMHACIPRFRIPAF
jgi:hypothetical protein